MFGLEKIKIPKHWSTVEVQIVFRCKEGTDIRKICLRLGEKAESGHFRS